MIYSFALPAIALLARPAHGALLLAVALAGLLTPSQTAWFGLDFALGVVAFEQRDTIARAVQALPAALRPAIPILGLGLLCLPLWHRMAPIGSLLGHSPREIAVMGVGAALLVISALTLPRFAKAIGSRPCNFLGRISYGVYLLHRPLLTLLAPLVLVPTLLASKLVVIHGVTLASAALLVALVVGGSIALAVLFHRFVERPAIALGHRLAQALERALGSRR